MADGDCPAVQLGAAALPPPRWPQAMGSMELHQY
jgi:hypothetical protein